MTVERIACLLTAESVLCYPLPDFPCLWISSFPLPSLCLPCRVAGCIRGKGGGIFSRPISLNTGTHSQYLLPPLPLLPFFLSFLVLIGIRMSACWAHFFVSKFPHRRFYSSLPVTLPTLPFCSSPAARLLCGSKEDLPGFPTLCDWLGELFQQLSDTEKNICLCILNGSSLCNTAKNGAKKKTKPSAWDALDSHRTVFTKYFRPRDY